MQSMHNALSSTVLVIHHIPDELRLDYARTAHEHVCVPAVEPSVRAVAWRKYSPRTAPSMEPFRDSQRDIDLDLLIRSSIIAAGDCLPTPTVVANSENLYVCLQLCILLYPRVWDVFASETLLLVSPSRALDWP